MNDEPINDPLKELEAALDVMPSPTFAAKVRTRVSSEEAYLPRWLFVTAAAGAIIVTGVMGTRMRMARELPVTSNAVVSSVSAPAPVVREATPPAINQLLRTKPKRTTVSRPEPEVLVLQDQMAGLEQLRARLRDGTLDGSVLPLTSMEQVRVSLSRPGDLSAPVAAEGSEVSPSVEPFRYGG